MILDFGFKVDDNFVYLRTLDPHSKQFFESVYKLDKVNLKLLEVSKH